MSFGSLGKVAFVLLAFMLEASGSQCCGPGCRAPAAEGSAAHYDAKYFNWQRGIGEEKARRENWEKTYGVLPGETVLDFGAGTAAILATLNSAGRRIAVEYSSVAREYIAQHSKGIEVHQYPESVPDGSVDLVVSTSVVEHVECPIQELRELMRKLRHGGRVVIGIKNEGVELWRNWVPNNRDNHLWTWNSMLLGNLLRASGFVIDHIDVSAAIKQQEASVVANGFGRQRHTFQYLYAFGHRPAPGEPWPQRLNGTLRIPAAPAPHGGAGAPTKSKYAPTLLDEHLVVESGSKHSGRRAHRLGAGHSSVLQPA